MWVACESVNHRQLLPQLEAVLVGARQLVRPREQLAVALADAHALDRHQRLVQQLAELGQQRSDPLARSHREHISGPGGCGQELARSRRPSRVPSTPSSTVAPATPRR